MRTLVQDLRFGFRAFARTPGFTLVIILTLALGIGANTAIFSVLNAVVLRPLPFPQPDRLAMVFTQFPTLDLEQFPLSAPEYLEYKNLNTSFESLAAFAVDSVSVAGRSEPTRARALFATSDLWKVLRVEATDGRVYSADEDIPGPASDVAVLSHELWQRAYEGDRSVVGSIIQVNSTAVTVLGVMPPSFDLLNNDVEIWLPMALDPANPGNRSGHNYRVVGRLAVGVSVEQATAELKTVYEKWDEIAANLHHPGDDEQRQHPVEIHSLSIVAVGDTGPALLMLLGIVGFVLLIACANVANLLLARAETRQRELAVRMALGAPRWRMIRQLLTESIALALLGGAGGLLLAWWIIKIMLVFIPDAVPRTDEIAIDPMVLAFTLLVAGATGILFGLAPVVRIRLPRLHIALKAAGARSPEGAEHHRFRNLLVIGEVALALVLVTGAGLMIRSFSRLQRVDPGFDPSGVLTMHLFLPQVKYPEFSQVTSFYNTLIDEVKALPGVRTAAVASGLPPRRQANYNSHRIESLMDDPGADMPNFDFLQVASPGYFEALGIPLIQGRLYDLRDNPDSEPVLIINRALADKYWAPPGAGAGPAADAADAGATSLKSGLSPLEDRILTGGADPDYLRIIGIVGDSHQGGMENPVGTEYFAPFDQIGALGFIPREMFLIVKVESGDPLAQLGPVSEIIRRMDASLPISAAQSMDGLVYDSIAAQRFATVLLLAFGLLAGSLAAIGIYSVMAFSVAQRTAEIGIRMAIGAQREDVLRLVLRQGAVLSAIGVALGLVFAIALARLLSVRLDAILYDLSPFDPVTLAAVASLLIVIALAASFIPARRATRIDPMVALRCD